jgi:Asp-tRNA(Asn)/Glu-tRNA(Gln) amidotransferase A subunit family amidase
MYLSRLHRYNGKLNNVVSFLDDYGRAEAQRADAEIAAGRYKGPLHGIPWGAKDIISVKGFTTTWGSPAFKEQRFDYDASIVEMLREAGAVLVAKLATGELASGDQWFGGQTKNPWNLSQGSSGSSAGPSSATAAGCVAFAIGTETSGSILSPSARCGLAGLRPTFGRVSRYGVMALSWTQDRLGPIVRYAEDAAIVMQTIAKPDGRDLSVSDVPFNWDAHVDVKKLKVGIIKESFDEITNPTAKKNADAALETLRSIGVAQMVPVSVPEFTTNVSAINVESVVFFDEHARAGHMKEARNGGRPAGRLVPAVEYLRAQRVRMMMMEKLAEATAHVDVYLVGANPIAESGGRGRGEGRGEGRGAGDATRAATTTTEPPRPQSVTQRHFAMANLACYPAMNVPNGFLETGSPTNFVIYGRPFGEMDVIALGKAYQDAAGFHLKKPTAIETS